MTAAVCPSTACSTAASRLYGTNPNPGTSGSKGWRYALRQVAESAPKVRPWKPRIAATTFVRQHLGALVVVESVGADTQPLNLFGHGLYHGGVGVSHVSHAVPADAVDVLLAVGVPHPGPLSAHQDQRLFGVQAAVVAVLQSDHLIFH
jgi:hypothetical protein